MTLQPDLTPSNNLEHIVRSNVEIPHAEQWTMKSRTGHHDYQIMVYKPVEPPPPSGYPVIYLLDANSVFGTMVEAVRVQGRRPEKTGAIPAMIVGIGYPIAAPFSPHRYYDFTPKATTKYTRKPDGTPIPEQGGADEFLRFIEEELKPDMEQQFQIDRGRQAIFGHSLGGLFVIHALFTKPGAFRYYIAGSPSLHWNQEVMQAEEQEFVARLGQHPVRVSVWIGMGEHEKKHPARNNDKASSLTERLSALKQPGLDIAYTEFEEENHVSVLPFLISRTLRFACSPES
ncbi:alpha/beta hydrolase-fold protein [Paenibacillus silvae]|uniref:alpha/beta hydrolase n=1 Tax=Paenibacillus silvae TaxID=1325358 RepID=UPI0025A0B055|nr:alpha/beta hydrolase-fold protein [Paenibacillus silvae]MDM5280882.1 alpha/beta hydrolase-fold protein [Paenibacillus silvae]